MEFELKVKRPIGMLELAHLNDNRPKTREDLSEAIDWVLLQWFPELANDENKRAIVGAMMTDTLMVWVRRGAGDEE